MKVIFVCSGNTCRSPMAQAIMMDALKKHNIENVEVDSFGLYCEKGDPISSGAKSALLSMDIEFDSESKPLTKEAVDDADYIICMTSSHKKALEGKVDSKKLFTMNELANKGEIIDPYGQSLEVYLKTADQIKESINVIISKLA